MLITYVSDYALCVQHTVKSAKIGPFWRFGWNYDGVGSNSIVVPTKCLFWPKIDFGWNDNRFEVFGLKVGHFLAKNG